MKNLLPMLLLLSLSACGQNQPPAPPRAPAPLISPQQMTAIQQGLYSENPRMQAAALTTLLRFPDIVQKHQQRVEALAVSTDARVKEAAQKVLAVAQVPLASE